MKQIFYLKDKKALAFIEQKATAGFWDKHWDAANKQNIRASHWSGTFSPLVEQYLSKDSLILEGGSGNAAVLSALQNQGYKAIGLDFASETQIAVKEKFPSMDLVIGDLKRIPFADESFDAYISGGVIEHFWDGYDPLAYEMKRVLRPGGYLFITFPTMSLLRKLKGLLKAYPSLTSAELEGRVDEFYQFALPRNAVVSEYEKIGFRCIEMTYYNGLKGFKDEVQLGRSFLQQVYEGHKLPSLRRVIDRFLSLFSAHSARLVLQKKDS